MQKKKTDIFAVKLDDEEQEISNALDKSKLKSINDFEEQAFAREAAANYFRKDARVTLRFSSLDLDRKE